MKQVRWIRFTLIAFLACFVAFASDGSVEAIQTYKVEGGSTYLVDHEGKLIYLFLPSGSFSYPLAERWPEPSKTWVSMWEPLLVGSADHVDLAEELDASKFAALEKIRNGELTYHVHWGGDTTEGKTFWGLYTHRYDMPLEFYDVLNGDRPMGWVSQIFEAALWGAPPEPINPVRLMDELGGGVGNANGGGP